MSLEYRSGRFWIYYRPTGRYGRPVRLAIPADIQEPAAAQSYHDEFIKDWRAAKGTREDEPRALTGLTIRELWKEYLKWSEAHHAATTHRDLKGITKHVEKYIGQYDAESIGPHHVQIYQRMRSADSVKQVGEATVPKPIPRAINKETAYLGGFVKWAGRNGHITPRRLQSDKLPYKRPLPTVLSADEVVRIIGAAEQPYQAYLLCLYAMGLRAVEARNMQWKDIDWNRGTVSMVQKGRGMKSLPMGDALAEALREIAPPEEELRAAQGKIPVFLNPKTGRAIHDIRKAIARACGAAKVTRRVTPHMLRHSCATHMVDEGVNLRVIQDFLGHTQISTTEIYTHVSLEAMRAAQSLIDGGFKKMGHGKLSNVVRLGTWRKSNPRP